MVSEHRAAVIFLKSLLGDLLDFIYPPFCGNCGSRLKDGQRNICPSCWQSLKLIEPPFCRRCGLPLDSTGPLCPACRTRQHLFSFARSAGLFSDSLQQIIHLLKYRHRKSLARPLAGMLATLMQQDRRFAAMEAILPVPLHPARERSRGYNQSERIAFHLARRTGLPQLKHILSRRRNTPSQSSLGWVHRKLNVQGAFRIDRPKAVSGIRLILVDDVLTTGATVDASTEALLEADAREVCVLTVARTPEPKIVP